MNTARNGVRRRHFKSLFGAISASIILMGDRAAFSADAGARPASYGQPCGVKLPYCGRFMTRLGDCILPGTFRVPTREKVVALTFDDGPSAEAMPAALDALDRHGIKATFFILGDRIDDAKTAAGRKRRAALAEAHRRGHEIAFHGLSHHSLFNVPSHAIRHEMRHLRRLAADLLGEQAAAESRFFRPPFGHANGRIERALKEDGLELIQASILPGDAWFPRGWSETPGPVANRILRELRPGAIIVLHVGENLGWDDQVFDTPDTAEIIDRIAPELKRRGYRAARLGDLLDAGRAGQGEGKMPGLRS